MNINSLIIGFLFVASSVFVEGTSRADTVTFNTSSLSGDPFYINFQFIDGSGTGDANNTVTIGSFSGVPVGSPTLNGGASGNLGTTVVLVDDTFFTEFIQQLTPSGSLSFDLLFTTNVDTDGTPDAFSFAILDGALNELPTTDPLGTNVLLMLDLSSSSPIIQQYELAVPEPATILLFGTGLAGIGMLIRKRRQV